MEKFQGQLWDAEEVVKAIEQYWQNNIYESAHRDALIELVSHYITSPKSSVLEVGCGTGLIYKRLVPEHLLGSSYVGVDVSRKMLEIARKNSPTGQFIVGDGYELKFADRAFDITLCFEVLGHIPEIGPFIGELCRVTKDICLFTVWPSEGEDIVEEHEEVCGVKFLHRKYADPYIKKILAEDGLENGWKVQVAILSAECWAYVLQRQEKKILLSSQDIFPFPGLRQRMSGLTQEREQHLLKTQENAIAELHQVVIARDTELGQLQAFLAATRAQVPELEGNLEAMRHMLATREGEFTRTQASFIAAQAELASHKRGTEELQGMLTARERELVRVSIALRQFAVLQQKAQVIAAEVDALRRRRVLRWMARLSSADLINDVAPAFQQLKDDSLLFTPDLKGFRLQSSTNLQFTPFLAYPLDLRRPNLCGVLLAPILELPLSQGLLGVEIISPANTIVAQSVLPCAQIDEPVPTRLVFPAIADSHQGRFWLRVFVREVATPVRVFEWRKYGWAGLGHLQTRAFCEMLLRHTDPACWRCCPSFPRLAR
ncbi:MAG: methyltransferase domain-containing protein [Deltaproteobacteria bacterium]|nr:methyltransferase domain-containing protein [Deltaproteobacteria bacterium]